jgi:RimJ/RimL family protein N-acetyltransferase
MCQDLENLIEPALVQAKHMPAIEFETHRLRLRQWRRADYAPLADLNADPKVMEFFPAPQDRKASEAAAEQMHAEIAERGWGLWAVDRRDTSEFIGFVGLHVPAGPLPFLPCVEVGWRLAAAHWGKGFASEAAAAALQVGFEQAQISEIVSFAAVLNKKSRAVMTRIGMRDTGVTFQHPRVPVKSPLRQHCLYLLNRDEWRELPGHSLIEPAYEGKKSAAG